MSSPATAAEVFSFVEKALLPPLITAAAGVVAEILQGRLSRGRTEANLSRLEAIQKILADDALGLSRPDKRALKEEARIIAESLQVLRRRHLALARTSTTVLHWENQPLARRLLTLPQPRNTAGWLATGLCLLFLYLAGVVLAALNAVITMDVGQDLPTFLGLMAVTIVLPLFLAITARARAGRLAAARVSRQPWRCRAPLLRSTPPVSTEVETGGVERSCLAGVLRMAAGVGQRCDHRPGAGRLAAFVGS